LSAQRFALSRGASDYVCADGSSSWLSSIPLRRIVCARPAILAVLHT
jgi:hypothetical protein